MYKSKLSDLLYSFLLCGARIDIFCDMYKIKARHYIEDKFCNYMEEPDRSLGYTLTRGSSQIDFITVIVAPMAHFIRKVINTEDDNHVKLLTPSDLLFFIRTLETLDFESARSEYYALLMEVTSDVGYVWEGVILFPDEVAEMHKHFKNAASLTGYFR